MKILHYFLGFPPYRTGGLTKFALDLMLSQHKQGHSVSALWPGQMGFLFHKTFIKKRKSIEGVENFELINPLPVPLDEGISNFPHFSRKCDKVVFIDFLKKLNPDVIHIHTLMGLYKEFVDASKELNIKVIFTSHDYFGLCPKVTLFRNGKTCDDLSCSHCVECNQWALSINKIKLMQSPGYRYLKNSFVVKKLRALHRSSFFEDVSCFKKDDSQIKDYAKQYRDLRTYYVEMLEEMDCIHFNSSVSEAVYRKYVKPQSSRLISITHNGIVDNRDSALDKNEGDVLRLTYLGSTNPIKGYYVLKMALDELWNEGFRQFKLKIFGMIQNPSPYMDVQYGRYNYSQLSSIFADTDILLVPSLWYETFGFVVLEALSFGVPVIVSDNVGAKDIVGDGGIIVKAGSKDSLKEAVKSLNKENIQTMKETIRNKNEIKTMNTFLTEINSIYAGECIKSNILESAIENYQFNVKH